MQKLFNVNETMSTNTDRNANQEAAHKDLKPQDQSVSAATSAHHTSSLAPCYGQSIHNTHFANL